MTYKEAITEEMTIIGRDPMTRFVGYGMTRGRAMGTLKDVPLDQIIETPVAENLMVGLAVGLSLRGKRPIVFIERCDFLLNAMDAIVNHLAKINLMSRGEFKPACILRIVVGNKEKPLFTGETHTQDFYEPFRQMVEPDGIVCVQIKEAWQAKGIFSGAYLRMCAGQSTAIFEYKDLY